jgi:hypothetical protein
MTVDYSASITRRPDLVKNPIDPVAPNGGPVLALPNFTATRWQQMLKVCATHRCPNLTTARYCTNCTAPARQANDQRRPSAARVTETSQVRDRRHRRRRQPHDTSEGADVSIAASITTNEVGHLELTGVAVRNNDASATRITANEHNETSPAAGTKPGTRPPGWGTTRKNSRRGPSQGCGFCCLHDPRFAIRGLLT